MIRNFKPAHVEEIEERYLVFDDGQGNGYWFPCDKDGKLPNNLDEMAYRNYQSCMDNQSEFKRANEVVQEVRLYSVPASGVCSCGNVVELTNEYIGACQCNLCGQWYNLFGEELLPPTEWEEDF